MVISQLYINIQNKVQYPQHLIPVRYTKIASNTKVLHNKNACSSRASESSTPLSVCVCCNNYEAETNDDDDLQVEQQTQIHQVTKYTRVDFSYNHRDCKSGWNILWHCTSSL